MWEDSGAIDKTPSLRRVAVISEPSQKDIPEKKFPVWNIINFSDLFAARYILLWLSIKLKLCSF